MAPSEGINAGVVYVLVKPSSKGFWERFVADNRAGAAKAGDDLGDRIGKAISSRIAKSIRDGLGDGLGQGGAGVRAQGTRFGNDFGGTFADTAKRRIEAALRSLPTPRIGVATTEAEQKLKDLHGELSTLSGKRIGVDIGATEALAELARIRAELEKLGGKSASVQVRVDTLDAAAKIAALQAELDRLDGRTATANAKVDTGDSAGALQTIVNAALAIGPAIVPAAAAGTAGILTLAGAALSAAPAIAAVGLAFHGIGGAIQALDAAQQAESKTGNTLVQQQKSLASGADQVRSAEASLANTRANAADSQRRSLQQIADAEHTYTQAQTEALRAQQDLNVAREEEKRSQEDTAQALKANAVDQAKATLDVAKLKQQLDQFGGEQTKLAYDAAVVQQEDLAIRGRRLAEDQARNQKTGIDGSKRVVQAQDAVARSQDRVVTAERGVTDARAQAASQARQSAFAISQAQQAVVTAQRSAAAASVAASATAGAAADKLADAFANLPASGQVFARFLYGLKPELLSLQTAAADGLLPGVQAGITVLLPYLGDVRTYIGDVSTEVGSLATRAATAFTAPFWRQFATLIGSDTVPVLEQMYTTTLNVAEGGAHIIEAFLPFERQVGGGIVGVSKKFLDFSQNLEHNQGFQDFVRYAETEVPHVVQTIGALVTAGLHIAQAYAPVGSVVVTELKLLATVINAIPVPIITTLATAITAYKTASLIGSGANSLLGSGLTTGITKMISFRTVTDSAGVATTGLQRAAGAASGFIGGPFVLALTAAATVVGFLIEQQANAKAKTEQLASSLAEFGNNFKDGVTPASEESARGILANNKELRGFVDAAHQAGASSKDVVDGLNGDQAARARVVDGLNAQIAQSKAASVEYAKLGLGQQANANAASEHAEKLEQLRDAFVTTNETNAEAGRLTTLLASDQQKVNDVFEAATPRTKLLSSAYKVLADGASTAADKAGALKDAEDSLFGAARTADQAAEDQAKALRTTNKALDDRSALSEKGAKSLDINTEAGAKLRDTLKDELAAINATYRANVANGVSIEAATKQHDDEVAALKKKSIQKGIDKDATQKLIDIYGLVPTSATTDIKATGLDATKAQLNELLTYQYALANGITLGEARDKLDPLVRSIGGKGNSRGGNLATGGPIVGPGTGTSDDVPAAERTTGAKYWLSNGEWVHKTAAVKYYGPDAMDDINNMRVPREAIRGYAGGGLIQQLLNQHYPYPTTTSKTKVPTKADVARIVTEGPSTGGSEDIKAFIRHAGTLPYVWATAGPSSFDCSGLASAVYGLMRGTGGGQGQRYFTTYDFANGAPAGFKPGAGGVLTVGVNPQTHMAGNYGGLGFEAASTRSGIKIGARAQKTSNFEKQFHLAKGGLVSAAVLDELGLDIGGDPSGMTVGGRKIPLGVYDTGGVLPEGLSLAYNGTGRPEVIPRPNPGGHNEPQFNVVLSAADPQLKALVSMIDVRVERATTGIARQLTRGVRT